MKVILFGATGMVGQGILRECLLDPEVTHVLTIGRNPTGIQNPKLQEIKKEDLFSYLDIESKLSGYDACFFTMGVSAAGLDEAGYRRMNYDLPLAAAQALVKLNPKMTFIYVSGQGTDSSEKGNVMWARVKGATENALLKLPFKGAYMFRPGIIQPMHGEVSRTALYRWGYVVMSPFIPLVKRIFPNAILNTVLIGQAMIKVARSGYPKKLLEPGDIRSAAH